MKKTLLTLFAVAQALWAAASVPFDWEKGNTYEPSEEVAYAVDLEPLYEMEVPTLALYLTNLSSTNPAKVVVSANMDGTTEERTYTIRPNGSQIWSKRASALIALNIQSINVVLSATEQVHLSAKPYETEDADEVCIKSKELNINGAALEVLTDTAWYMLDLTSLSNEDIILQLSGSATDTLVAISADCPASGKTILTPSAEGTYTISNALLSPLTEENLYVRVISHTRSSLLLRATTVSAAANTIDYSEATLAELETRYYVGKPGETAPGSMGAPRKAAAKAPSTLDHTAIINWLNTNGETYAAGEKDGKFIFNEEALSNAFAAWQAEQSSTMPVTLTLPIWKEWFASPENMTNFVYDEDFDPGNYRRDFYIALETIKQPKMQPEISINNEDNTIDNELHMLIAFSSEETPAAPLAYTDKTIVVPAGIIGKTDIAKNIIDGLDETAAKYIFVRFTAQKPVYVSMRLKRLHEGDKCSRAIPLDTENAMYPETDLEQWYNTDITPLKDSSAPKHLKLTLTNLSTSPAKIAEKVALSCPSEDADLMHQLFTLAAGESISDTLHYTTYSKFVEDNLFVVFTADQSIKITAEYVDAETTNDDACLEATDFDMQFGHTLRADSTAWYRVRLSDLRLEKDKESIATLKLLNQSAAEATVEVSHSLECPVLVSAPVQSVTLAANATSTRTFPRDYISKTESEYLYLQVRATQPIAFSISMEPIEPTEADECRAARQFNIVSGEYIEPDTTMWFFLDIKDIKTSGEDLRATLNNLSTTEETKVTLKLAPTCPCKTAETTIRTISAGYSRTDTIVNTTMQSFGDTIYFSVRSSKTRLQLQLQPVEPKPFTPITICDQAIEIEDGTLYTQHGNTTWYYLLTDTIIKNPIITPEVYIKNRGSKQTIITEAAYHCPVTAAMTRRTRTLNAGASQTRIIERSMMESLVEQHIDTVYFRLIATDDFEFSISLTDPASGNDCEDAITLKPNQGYLQKAGMGLWYQLLMADYPTHHTLTPTIKNVNKKSGKVTISGYMNCDADPLETTTRTLSAGGTFKSEVQTESLHTIADSVIYLYLYTAEDDSITFYMQEAEKLDEPDTLCLHAFPLSPNVLYDLDATQDTIWYSVDLMNLRDNTAGDAVFTITNTGTTTAKLNADLTYECPLIYDDIAKKSLSIAPGSKYQREASRDLIMSNKADYAYLRITTHHSQGVQFILSITQAAGDECGNPIIINDEGGNIHPADSAGVWYEWDLEEIGSSLHFTNVSDEEVTIHSFLHVDCRTTTAYDSLKREDIYTLAAGADSVIAIDSLFIRHSLKSQVLYLEYGTTGGPTHLWIEKGGVGAREVLVENYDTLCLMPGDLPTLPDTLPHAYDKTELRTLDTIRTHFFVTPPAMVSYDTLSVRPVMQLGLEPSITAVSDWLLKIYEADHLANDTVSLVTTLEWETETVPGNENFQLWEDCPWTATMLPRNFTADTVTIVYRATTEQMCQFEDTLRVAVEPWRVDSVVENDTVCYGTEITWRGHTSVTLKNDTLLSDTLSNVQADTLLYGNTYQITLDSVYTIYYKVLPDVDSTTYISDTLICYGEPFMWHDTISVEEAGIYTDTLINQLGCDSIIYTLKVAILPDVDSTTYVSDTLICYGETFTWHDTISVEQAGIYTDTLFNQLGCDSIIYTLKVDMLPDTVWEKMDTLLCYGVTFMWHDTILVDTEGAYRDTLFNQLGCDSIIYQINVIILPDTVWEKQDTLLCYGETFEWHGQIIDTQKMYYDTLRNQLDCDSVLYSLNVRYLPDVDSTSYVSDTVLCYSDVIEWHELSIDASGVYKDTLQNQLGCDSIIYTLNVEIKPEARDSIDDDIMIPNGSSYTWFGKEYSVAGTYYDTLRYVGTACDSVWGKMTLSFETVYEYKDAIVDTVCPGTEYVGAKTTHTILEYTTWKDTVQYRGETEWVDTVYTYEVYAYTTEIAPIAIEEYIRLICGQQVNADSIASATTAIEALIAAEPLFVPNYEIEWNLPKGNISSDIDEQLVSYTVKADCGMEQKVETTLSVEIATYENTAEYESIAAKSLFGGRLLMVNLDAIRELIDTIPSEDDVIWYRVVGEIDEPECTSCDDEEMGRGYYYTLPDAGEIFTTGSEVYYARITLIESQTKDACGQVMRTMTLDSSNDAKKAPGLRPNYVSPGENIEVYNLDASSQTSIRVYDVEGLLVGTYSAEQAESILLQAAQNSGYYMVKIENADNSITLRYIVK